MQDILENSPQSNGVKTYKTDSVAALNRFHYWQKATCDAFLPLEAQQLDDSKFSGQIQVVNAGGIGVSSIKADKQIIRRSRRLIQSSEASSLIFICQTSGFGTVRQDSQDVKLAAGDITFVDSDRPYEFKFDDVFEQAVLQVPKQIFLERCRWLVGVPPIKLDGKNPLAQLVQVNLKTLLEVGGSLPQSTRPMVFNNVINLLSTALGEAFGETLPDTSEPKLMHIQRAKHYIIQNLKESRLCPDGVAHACDISPRYLRALFCEQGQTVSAWIRTQRLESARMELERTSQTGAPINQIAYRWGFSDYSHFCRLFKSAYGMSPRMWRNQILTPPS